MSNWQQIVVPPDTPIRSVIEIIEESALQIALVIDQNKCLIGTVTDGDIRRGILKGISIDNFVKNVMNKSPFCITPNYNRDELLAAMNERKVHQVPVVNENDNVIDLVTIDLLYNKKIKRNNWVVLMAGGLGTRLLPLTKAKPKPLIEVRGKPLLENIIENFISYGFRKFYISVNYKGDMIKKHFGNGEKWGSEIRYLDEDTPLGTAGALGLIDDARGQPIIVMNGDLVTKVNISEMLNFHIQSNAKATMGVREYDHQVPFGVVEVDNGAILSIDEKPIHQFLVNGGIYILQPETLKKLPEGLAIDMPSFFEHLIKDGKKCVAFPIHEYWIDIGRFEDMERAKDNT